MRPNIKKMDLHDNSGTELQNKIRELIDENSRYKQILENVRYQYSTYTQLQEVFVWFEVQVFDSWSWTNVQIMDLFIYIF